MVKVALCSNFVPVKDVLNNIDERVAITVPLEDLRLCSIDLWFDEKRKLAVGSFAVTVDDAVNFVGDIEKTSAPPEKLKLFEFDP
jgi:hypothetical protein